MSANSGANSDGLNPNINPHTLAENCFRKLVQEINFNRIDLITTPIFE